MIIGNPPYLETQEVPYSPRHFTCMDSGAIHAMCVERSLALCVRGGCYKHDSAPGLSVYSTYDHFAADVREKPRLLVLELLLETGEAVRYGKPSFNHLRICKATK